MRLTLQLGLAIVLVGAGMVIGFEVGGRAGFSEGYSNASVAHDVTNGALVMDALRALREGKIDGARDRLESTLNISIHNVWANSQFSPTLQSFAPSWAHAEPTAALKGIAEYRQRHPFEDATGKEAIDWLLARYGTPPQAEH